MSNLKNNTLWLIPLLFLVIITPFTPYLDVEISRYFYELGMPGAHFINNPFFTFVYWYGTIPGFVLAGGAIIVFIASFYKPAWKKWQKASLTIILTLIIGAGLFVHAILKDHWGRPRPKQVVQFGGKNSFRPYYTPNFDKQHEVMKSFSCGHCSMGFLFFSLALAGRRQQNKKVYYIGMFLAFFLGGLLSITRIAQGGHFLSDTIVTALIMWWTALLCDHCLARYSHATEPES